MASSGLSHLSSKRRGRGRGSQPARSQLLSPLDTQPLPRPTPRVPPPLPSWPHNTTTTTTGPRPLPQYKIPDDVTYLSSDSEEEITADVISKVMSGYSEDSASHVRDKLNQLYNTSSTSCLVCISTVRHTEAIWSCPQCSDSFHLVCIQKWARDGIKAPSLLSDELFPDKDVPWFCPKCREQFSKHQIPNRYKCYCGKLEDPPQDAWLAPHSCGEVCGAPLLPQCGHTCLLLCHPGKCPPCPKQVPASCYCGRRRNVTRRCGMARWSCGEACGKALQCGIHYCAEQCHAGQCAPCQDQSSQRCRCGKESMSRSCLEWDWGCGRVCGTPLPCGNHRCNTTCHPPGSCPPCPLSLRTTCPCGKVPLAPSYPCTLDLPTCNMTCDKTLPCGQHLCFALCHLGPCEGCQQVRDKACRCGRSHKLVACSLELVCGRPCGKPRECGRHSCRRRCCEGNSCNTCDKLCDKTLPCRNHKCVADCHSGRCYPCTAKVDVTCKCSTASISVACGRERSTRPPRCKRRCLEPSDCHHASRDPHSCHFGNCPSCKQVCGVKLECSHVCEATCHDKVRTKGKGPGEDISFERKPCPPCQKLEQVSCKGGHEISTMKCSVLTEYSCGRKCGKLLDCKNHSCLKECHSDNEECSVCEEMCARAGSCAHPCTRACHEGACRPCRQYVRMPCYCSILHLSVKCLDITGGKDLDTLLSCGSKCSKVIQCGHTCRRTCHLGACSEQTECKKKVVFYCTCKNLKIEYKCGEVFGSNETRNPSCDESCQVKLKSKGAAEKESAKEEVSGPVESVHRRRGRGRRREEQTISEQSCCKRHGYKMLTLIGVLIAVIGMYLCTLET